MDAFVGNEARVNVPGWKAVLLGAGLMLSASTLAIESSNPKTGDAEAIKQGEEIYAKFCQQCHGATADGQSRVFAKYTKDLRKFPYGFNEFVSLVQKGRPKNGMPPWEEYLDYDAISAVGAYLETLAIEGAYWK